MIKIRRYGKTLIVKFENGKWIQVDSSTIVHEGYGFIPFKNWFISFFGYGFGTVDVKGRKQNDACYSQIYSLQ